MSRLTAIALILLTSTSLGLACGKERWPVKVGKDNDAAAVSTAPTHTTISELASVNAPTNPNAQPNSRYAFELNTFSVDGILTVIKGEQDEDYHLVIAEVGNPSTTMIVEAP